MYTSTFTFATGEFDDEFHALDNVIAQVVRCYGDGGIPHPLADGTAASHSS